MDVDSHLATAFYSNSIDFIPKGRIRGHLRDKIL